VSAGVGAPEPEAAKGAVPHAAPSPERTCDKNAHVCMYIYIYIYIYR